MDKRPVFPRQVVGNMGLFYVCYRLSREGWNVLPTSRNAKGPDVVLLNEDAEVRHTVQVKSLSKRLAVNFGTKKDNMLFEFLIVCTRLESGSPECFILTKAEVLRGVSDYGKDHRIWLEPKHYDREGFREAWHKIPKVRR